METNNHNELLFCYDIKEASLRNPATLTNTVTGTLFNYQLCSFQTPLLLIPSTTSNFTTTNFTTTNFTTTKTTTATTTTANMTRKHKVRSSVLKRDPLNPILEHPNTTLFNHQIHPHQTWDPPLDPTKISVYYYLTESTYCYQPPNSTATVSPCASPCTLIDIPTDLKSKQLPPSTSPKTTTTVWSTIPVGARYFWGGLLLFPLWYIGSCLAVPDSLLQTPYPDSQLRQFREWRNWNRAMAGLMTLVLLSLVTLLCWGFLEDYLATYSLILP